MVERVDGNVASRGLSSAELPKEDPKFLEFHQALEGRLGRSVEMGLAKSLFERREAGLEAQAQSRASQQAFESARSLEGIETAVDQNVAVATGRTQNVRAGELSPEDRANILNLRHGPVLPPLSAETQVFDERAQTTLERMLAPIMGSVQVGGERPQSVPELASSIQEQAVTTAPMSARGGLSGTQVSRSALTNQASGSPSLSFNLSGGVTPRSRAPQGDGFVSSMRLDAGSINLDAFIMMFLARYLEDSNEHRAAMRKLSRLEGELQIGFKDLEIAMTKVQQRYELMTAYMKTGKATLDTVKSAAQKGASEVGGEQYMDTQNPDAPANAKAISELGENRTKQREALETLLGPESTREVLSMGELDTLEKQTQALEPGDERDAKLQAITDYRASTDAIRKAYGPVTRHGNIERELASPSMAASDAPGRAELLDEKRQLEEQFEKDFKLLGSMPFGWEALKNRRAVISSRFEHASRELARVDQGDGRYAEMSDQDKTAVKETLIGMRTDALYALSAFDSGTIQNSPFQGDDAYIAEMKGRAETIRSGQPAGEDTPQVSADPVQAEHIETMVGLREPDNISVGVASEDATLRELESKAKAGRELLSYDPPGKKIIDGLVAVGGWAEMGQGLIDSAVQVSGQNALKAIGGAQGQLAAAKSEAEGMLNQQLQKSQRMMERLLMTLAMSRRG